MAEGNDRVGADIVPLLQQELPRHVLAGYMRYQKIRTLGSGGKAEVFLCCDQTLGREVAVKVLHPHLMSSSEEQHMLVREARIMAALVHPGIPRIHDLGRDFEGRPYYAMSYVPGTTFRDMLGRRCKARSITAQQYHLQQCLSVLIDLSAILELAHGMRVVHSDLKPDNVLIDRRGGVHLIDWGLATILDSRGELTGEDAFAIARGVQGSPLYMSPEQANREATVSAATDIYSLGVMLYESLTHSTPFQGNDADEVLAKVVAEKVPRPRQRNANVYVPPELERVCMKALAREPGQRHGNIQAFAADLREAQLELLIDYDRAAFSRSAFSTLSENTWRDDELLCYV